MLWLFVSQVEFLNTWYKPVSKQSFYLPTQTGHTPLHIAAEKGHPHVVSLLLKYNADVHAVTKVCQYHILYYLNDDETCLN